MTSRIGTANHFMGSPPHSRGIGNPPKLIDSSSPTLCSRLNSFGPAYATNAPSHAPPGGMVDPGGLRDERRGVPVAAQRDPIAGGGGLLDLLAVSRGTAERAQAAVVPAGMREVV